MKLSEKVLRTPKTHGATPRAIHCMPHEAQAGCAAAYVWRRKMQHPFSDDVEALAKANSARLSTSILLEVCILSSLDARCCPANTSQLDPAFPAAPRPDSRICKLYSFFLSRQLS